MTNTENNYTLAALIERGGVYYRIEGSSPQDILSNVTELLPAFSGLNAGLLLQATLEREALMSTGIGRGIAVPHPRNPVLGDAGQPFVALGFPDRPVDWNTPDGSRVHAFFWIVSISAKQHLYTLSKINFLCQQEKILSLIKARVSEEEIIAAIRDAEKAWAGK